MGVRDLPGHASFIVQSDRGSFGQSHSCLTENKSF